ncbi:hypothetical protein HYFRA_00007530 [Hymenoscyphus fraxineus]|uniref:SAP domain-containing protein n=1 Tax=Hymenoscyphus fraxineus TaxID=746836 RepID=A0A9N9KVL2_9HELO|nr:hypothetical protein HYFRA_00007530 [Hymenoscyphus fraxineus]
MGPNKRNEDDKSGKPSETGEGYRKYTISELRQLLRDRGIQFAWKHKKDDLIKLLYETDINKKQLSTNHNDETDPDGSLRYAERVERITSDMRTLDLYHDDELCKVFDEARRVQREWDQDRARKAQELKDEAKLYQRRSEKMVSRANFKGDKQEVKRLTSRRIYDASNNFAQYQNGFEERWRARSRNLSATYARDSARYVERLAKMTRDPFSDESNSPSPSSSPPPRRPLQDSSLQRAARRSSPITYNLISDDEPRMTDSYGPPRELSTRNTSPRPYNGFTTQSGGVRN